MVKEMHIFITLEVYVIICYTDDQIFNRWLAHSLNIEGMFS